FSRAPDVHSTPEDKRKPVSFCFSGGRAECRRGATARAAGHCPACVTDVPGFGAPASVQPVQPAELTVWSGTISAEKPSPLARCCAQTQRRCLVRERYSPPPVR